MIDIESSVFSIVAQAVREKYPKIFMTGEYVMSPSSFPCVSLVEIDNAVYRNSSTNTVEENHAAVTYEVNVYSNKSTGKKAECKAIIGLIDTQLANLGFTRTMLEPIPNMDEATIYRMLGRYRAVVSKEHTIYRR
jgi:hypothetical protein